MYRNVHLVLTVVNNFGTFSGANTLRKMVQSATTKSITNEQTKTENRPLKLYSEGGFCLLRIRLFSLSQRPNGKLRRAACKPQAKSVAVLLGRGAAASLALNPLYLTGGGTTTRNYKNLRPHAGNLVISDSAVSETSGLGSFI